LPSLDFLSAFWHDSGNKPAWRVMDPRTIIKQTKIIKKQNEWSTLEIPPRMSIYPKTKALPPGWEWMAATLDAGGGAEMLLLVQALPRRDNWKAWLIVGERHSRSVLARLEHHGAAGEGLHMHADCSSNGPVLGPESIQAADNNRLPRRPNAARRKEPWTKEAFWLYACSTFRIEVPPPSQPMLP
jgi:hypothetical protein